MLELVNQLLALVLPTVVVAVTTWLAITVKSQLLPLVSAWVHQRLTDRQLDFLKQVVLDGVQYAEAKGYTATVKLAGEQKRAAAIAWIEKTLALRGLRVDLEVLMGLVESTWAETYGANKLFQAAYRKPDAE